MTEVLSRLPGWRARLAAVLTARPRRLFAWGDDCVLGLAVPAIQAITGKDLGADFRGKYSDEAGALGVIKGMGFSGLADAISSRLPEIHPAQLTIGDIALVPSGTPGDFDLAVGVVAGDRIVVVTPKGTGSVALSLARRGFKVG